MKKSTHSQKVLLGDRKIGPGEPVFVIAEIGINHDGNLDQACKMIEAAAAAGADAVKFQTFQAEKLISENECRLSHVGGDIDLSAFFKSFQFDFNQWKQLKEKADDSGIIFLSTPFDEQGAEWLLKLGVPAFKVASGDLTHLKLLNFLAETGKPIILSTGMATMEEIEKAVNLIQKNNSPLILLHCITSYPAPNEELNLSVIRTLTEHFPLPVGYSDHSCGISACLSSVALGASIIEKHFILDSCAQGPDAAHSADPVQLEQLITSAQKVRKSLGSGKKAPSACEMENKRVSRRSIYAKTDILPGQQINENMLICLRPASGFPAERFFEVIGACPRRVVRAGELITGKMVAEFQYPFDQKEQKCEIKT